MPQLSDLAIFNPLATSSPLSAWGFASDFLVIFVLCGALFLFAWYVGKGPFIGLMISFYAGYALYSIFPYAAYLPTSPPAAALAASLGIYLGLTAVSYLVLRRTVVSDFVYVGFFGLAILSLLGTGLLLALAYHVFPVQEVHQFTPALNMFFAPREYFFWWFAAPLVGLFFLAR